MAVQLLWVLTHSYCQARAVANNAAARAIVAAELGGPVGYGLPITPYQGKRLVAPAMPWQGPAGGPGAVPLKLMVAMDGAPVCLEHSNARFPDAYLGPHQPLLVRQQAAWDAMQRYIETFYDCGFHQVVVFFDPNRAAPFFASHNPAVVANNFRALPVSAVDPRRHAPGAAAYDFYLIMDFVKARLDHFGVPWRQDAGFNGDAQVARAVRHGFEGHECFGHSTDGDVCVNAARSLQIVHYTGTGQPVMVHFVRDAWLNSLHIPPVHHVDVIQTFQALDRLTGDRASLTAPATPPGFTSRLHGQAGNPNPCVLYTLNQPGYGGAAGPDRELHFVEDFIIPALVEILAVQIPRAAAPGGMFAGVNTILQALDTFRPGQPNAGAVFPHIAGATHHVVASNAILAEWLNYTNLERQEARAFYAWGRGNMF